MANAPSGSPTDPQDNSLLSAQTVAAQAHLAMESPDAALRVLPASASSQQSPAWRVWLAAATQSAGRGNLTSLQSITPDASATPGQTWQSLITLAQAWRSAASSLEEAGRDAFATADETATRLTVAYADKLRNTPDAPALAWQQAGMLLSPAGDADAARRAYERALALDANLPIATNNLAMLLVDAGGSGDLEQAERMMDDLLAREDMAEIAARAAFLDTKATVSMARDNTDAALSALDEAVELQPREPAWQLHRAEVLAELGRGGDARRALNEVRRLVPSLNNSPLQERYEALRKRLDGSGS